MSKDELLTMPKWRLTNHIETSVALFYAKVLCLQGGWFWNYMKNLKKGVYLSLPNLGIEMVK
jgi:hypothetical protein